MPITLSLMNFIIHNQKNLQIHPYTISMQGISTIFIDKMPNYLVFREGFYTGIKIFSLPHSPIFVTNDTENLRQP